MLSHQVVWDQHGDGGVAAGWGDGRDWQTILSNVPPNSRSMEALSKSLAGRWVKTVRASPPGRAPAYPYLNHASYWYRGVLGLEFHN